MAREFREDHLVCVAAARPKTGNGGGNAERERERKVRKGRRRRWWNWRRKLVAHDGWLGVSFYNRIRVHPPLSSRCIIVTPTPPIRVLPKLAEWSPASLPLIVLRIMPAPACEPSFLIKRNLCRLLVRSLGNSELGTRSRRN